MLVPPQLDTQSRDAPLSRYPPEAHWKHEESEPIDEADRAARATRTYVTRQHRREIGQMTTPYLQAREKCGLSS
jgi:hypothetical protein